MDVDGKYGWIPSNYLGRFLPKIPKHGEFWLNHGKLDLEERQRLWESWGVIHGTGTYREYAMATCIELYIDDQIMLIDGYCKKMEMELTLLIPKAINHIIMYYFSIMEDIWIERRHSFLNEWDEEMAEVYLYGMRIKKHLQNSQPFYSY